MNNPRLQIIRGLPGSGKTTLAARLYPHIMRIETDMFFTRGGEYRFTLERNAEVVELFCAAVRSFCEARMDLVLTGVFAAHTERLGRVVVWAKAFGYDVFIQTLTDNFGNTHGVPPEHLEAMRKNFVSDEELREIYGTDVVFGLMSTGLKLVPEESK